MKAKIAVMLLVIAPLCQAEWRPLETREEADWRRSTERYQQYKDNGYRTPLGGYSQPLGDTGGYGYGSYPRSRVPTYEGSGLGVRPRGYR